MDLPWRDIKNIAHNKKRLLYNDFDIILLGVSQIRPPTPLLPCHIL